MNMLKALLVGTLLAAPGVALADRITVTGEGQVAAVPDMATLTLGVTTQAATATEAMQANATQLQAVMDRLKDAGIAEADIQTTGLQLNPNWTQAENQARRIDGYTADNMLTVRVRQIDGLGAVLDTVVADGANTLNGLAFDVADPKPLIDEARKQAVADAMDRARKLADAAGVPLGDIESITEGGGAQGPVPMFRMEASAATPIAGGEVSRSSQVTITFDIPDAT
ncbi:SIMPL domain-containing protein [Falsirhodobacter sp. 20TX0035]|uniref:SIMPL domain-containing protein n=1 Tax=Falsirhodobacter sp. 20TX0035 TaxID=3022019 RepID=UPI002330718D|nr:SIMPL domain-containing protein [Falsirhodobacter sp. 20TX0035]MDB6452097.1 SIMPL domain-containing protein [Falsirhodobacter sp. 20TX0035]